MQENDSSWEIPEVARAQAGQAGIELDAAFIARPYVVLYGVMALIPWQEKWKVWDFGCGSGHYSLFFQKWFPLLNYVGTDPSQAMIHYAEGAERPGTFHHNPIEFWLDRGPGWWEEYIDIALFAQSIEYTSAPKSVLRAVLQATLNGWLILHKLRWTGTESHSVIEPTYEGHEDPIYLWNRGEFIEIVAKERRPKKILRWPHSNIETWVFAPGERFDTKLWT